MEAAEEDDQVRGVKKNILLDQNFVLSEVSETQLRRNAQIFHNFEFLLCM